MAKIRWPLTIFDVDGVLADERHRVEHAINGNWGVYFHPEMLRRDGIWPEGRRAYENAVIAGHDVAYCTGRREDLKVATKRWFKAGKVFDPEHPLIMRKVQHTTRGGYPLPRLKRLIIAEALYIYDEIDLWDDDPEVIAAVRDLPGVRARHCTWYIKPASLVRRAST